MSQWLPLSVGPNMSGMSWRHMSRPSYHLCPSAWTHLTSCRLQSGSRTSVSPSFSEEKPEELQQQLTFGSSWNRRAEPATRRRVDAHSCWSGATCSLALTIFNAAALLHLHARLPAATGEFLQSFDGMASTGGRGEAASDAGEQHQKSGGNKVKCEGGRDVMSHQLERVQTESSQRPHRRPFPFNFNKPETDHGCTPQDGLFVPRPRAEPFPHLNETRVLATAACEPNYSGVWEWGRVM